MLAEDKINEKRNPVWHSINQENSILIWFRFIPKSYCRSRFTKWKWNNDVHPEAPSNSRSAVHPLRKSTVFIYFVQPFTVIITNVDLKFRFISQSYQTKPTKIWTTGILELPFKAHLSKTKKKWQWLLSRLRSDILIEMIGHTSIPFIVYLAIVVWYSS